MKKTGKDFEGREGDFYKLDNMYSMLTVYNGYLDGLPGSSASSCEDDGGDRFLQDPEPPSRRLPPSFLQEPAAEGGSARLEPLGPIGSTFLELWDPEGSILLVLPGSFLQELPPGIVSVRVMARVKAALIRTQKVLYKSELNFNY